MKKVRKLLFALLCLLLTYNGFSANNLHIILADSAAIPSNVTLGNGFIFHVLVRNDDTTTFIGTIDLAYFVIHGDTSSGSGSDTVSGLEYTAVVDTLGPGDTAIKTITVHVTQPAFKTGPSVVVIWPIAFNGQADNYVSFHVNVLSNGIDDPEEQKLQLFRRGHSIFISKWPEIQVWQVRIYNVLGELLLDVPNPLNDVPLPELSEGIYIAEVRYNNNRRRTLKFYY